MAQPDEAQPTAVTPDRQPYPQIPMDQRVVGSFHVEVTPGPEGGRFLAVHCFKRGETLVLNMSDDEGAERVSNELKPSRVARANGTIPGKSGLVVP